MGFCPFNNVAIAALNAHGLERVLVFDWQVNAPTAGFDTMAGAVRRLGAELRGARGNAGPRRGSGWVQGAVGM